MGDERVPSAHLRAEREHRYRDRPRTLWPAYGPGVVNPQPSVIRARMATGSRLNFAVRV